MEFLPWIMHDSVFQSRALLQISHYTFSAFGIAIAIGVSILGAVRGIYITRSSLIGAAIKAPRITSKNLISSSNHNSSPSTSYQFQPSPMYIYIRPHYNVNLLSIVVNGQSLPIDPSVFSTSVNRGTIIDSRTTLAYLAHEVYDPFVNAITQVVSQSVPFLSRGSQCFFVSSRANISAGKHNSNSAALPSSASMASSMTSGLNMAETLAQGPPDVQATTQFSVGTQRLEEIAIKQFKQLIPVTPSMPKALVLNSPEKSKTKGAQQQHQTSSTHLCNHSPRGTLMKSDMPKTSSLGKLQVLKPARERNDIPYPTKDSLSPTNASKVPNNPLTAASSVGVSPPLRSPIKNPVVVSGVVPSVLEKKPSAQLRSRNDFFNLVRKKSLTNSSSPVADSVSTVSQSVLEQPSETEAAALLPPGEDSLSANQSDMVQSEMNGLISDKDACDGPQKSRDNGETRSSSDLILCSEEEEAAFLRSLGWDENAGEDEGLTEEEIREFYRDASKYIKPRPSSKTSL